MTWDAALARAGSAGALVALFAAMPFVSTTYAQQPVASESTESTTMLPDAGEGTSEGEAEAEPPREPRAWETPIRPTPVQAFLVYPFALMSPGIALGYERALPHRFSLLGRGAFWAPVGGDYRSRNVGLSVEARWYILGRGPFTRFEGDTIVGPYLGARFGVTQTILVDAREDRRVGTAQRLAFESSFGFRMAIRGRVEVTPFVGALFYSDVLDGLATTVRPSLSWGFTLGGLVGRLRG